MAIKIGKAFSISSGVKKAMMTELAIFLAGALVAGPIFAAQSPHSIGGKPAALASNPASSTTLKVKSFSVLGAGALTGVTSDSTCFGEVCNASGGLCECDAYGGTTKAPILGSSTWTVEFTVNDNDTTLTGNGGRCFPAEGELTITSTKGDIRAEISGPVCQNFLGGSSFVLQYGQAFGIDPALSDGSALGLNGGGSFSLSEDLDNADFTTMTAVGFSAK